MITNEDYLDQAVCVQVHGEPRWGRIESAFEEREWDDDRGYGTETYFDVALTKGGYATINRRDAEEQLKLR